MGGRKNTTFIHRGKNLSKHLNGNLTEEEAIMLDDLTSMIKEKDGLVLSKQQTFIFAIRKTYLNYKEK